MEPVPLTAMTLMFLDPRTAPMPNRIGLLTKRYANVPIAIEKLFSDEAQGFVVRMLALMQRSGYSANEFSPHLIHWISATVPSTLPGAWGGRIPPLTLPGCHKKLDLITTFKQRRPTTIWWGWPFFYCLNQIGNNCPSY